MPGSATGGEEVRDAAGNDVPGAGDAAQRRPDPLRPRLADDRRRAPVSSRPPPSAPSTQLGFPARVCAQRRRNTQGRRILFNPTAWIPRYPFGLY
jgi:hypothetical protein